MSEPLRTEQERAIAATPTEVLERYIKPEESPEVAEAIAPLTDEQEARLRERVGYLTDSSAGERWIDGDIWMQTFATIDALRAALGAERAKVEELGRDKREWALALQSLTPGGSEYVDDPGRCVAYVRGVRAMQHKSMISAIQDRNDAEAKIEAELKRAEAAVDRAEGREVSIRTNVKFRLQVHGLTRKLEAAREAIRSAMAVCRFGSTASSLLGKALAATAPDAKEELPKCLSAVRRTWTRRKRPAFTVERYYLIRQTRRRGSRYGNQGTHDPVIAYQTMLHEHCEDSLEAEKLAILAHYQAIKRVKLEIYEGHQPMRFGGD